MDFKDYPESHQVPMEKLDEILSKSNISSTVNLAPEFVLSIASPYEPFRVKKMGFEIDIMLDKPKGMFLRFLSFSLT